VLNVPANLTNAIVVSAQALNTLALRDNGTVVAWGGNDFGQTNVPATLSSASAIAAGGEHSLAVSNGLVVAWGNNGNGQCTVPAGLNNVWDVAAGWAHSVALKKDGTVVCWGDNSHGETNVPAGLSNVVAIVAGGGEPFDDSAYTWALKSDGTVVGWGDSEVFDPVDGLTNVIMIAAGADHALAIRTGPRSPVITVEPTDQYQVAGGSITLATRGLGLYGVTYQWQTNGVNWSGATNATLTLTNVQAAQLGNYRVLVSNEAGSILSSNATLSFVTAPVIVSQTILSSMFVFYQSSVTLSVVATAPGQFSGFPLGYQWQLNGTNISGTNSASYTFSAATSGTYSIIVTNVVGSVTSIWQMIVVYPGGVLGWGSNTNGQLNCPTQITNVISLAAGKVHGVVALESGGVTNWGSYWTGTNFVSVVAPPLLTNAIAVAARFRHDLALKTDGTVVGWGLNDFGQTNVPARATNVIAISAGGQQSLALNKAGTVLQWGETTVPVPAGLTNVTAIASGTNFHLALLKNSTVVAWGANNYGQTNIPANLSNIVAVAAGGAHALALKWTARSSHRAL
jgi:alpha-tubulin suppressor-like RCC1 family protein